MTKMNLVFALALILGLCHFAVAQQTVGGITGTLTDPTGAVVPKVEVKLLNQGTGLTKTATTNQRGVYDFPDLPIGNYTLTFTAEGFKTEVHNAILVQANRTTTVSVQLQPGAANATVEVTATPLLNQVDTTNGYILGANTIQEIPLGTGSFTQLAVLSPGVNADLLGGSGSDSGLGNQAIWANGQRDSSNTFTFNGVDSNNLFNGKSTSQVGENRFVLNTGERFRPGGQIATNTGVYTAVGEALPSAPPETIQELRVNTSMYDASQGATSGAHIDVITKSGTNDFHGQLWGMRQTNAMNAAPYFFKRPDSGIPANDVNPPLHRGVFGGALGGPIVKNKMFFYASYQGTRVHDQLTGLSFATVPLGLTNDRSVGALVNLANQISALNGPGSPTYTASQLNPAALAILQAKAPNGSFFVPSPSITDLNTASTLGYDAVIAGPPSTFTADQFIGNIDYNFGSRDLLAAKYFFQRDPTTSPFAVSDLVGFPQSLNAGSQVFSLDNTASIHPNLTWEQKIGFVRQIAYAHTSQAYKPQDFGINLFGNTNFPGITLNSVESDLGSGMNIGPASNFANTGVFQNQWQVASNLNWVRGRNNMSFGYSFDYNQLNVVNKQTDVALLTFDDFPSFLTGSLNTFAQNSAFFQGPSSRYYRARQFGAFAQDKLRVSQTISLTLGARFDWDGPLAEKYGRLVNFDPSRYQYNFATDTIVNDGLIVAGNNPQFHTQGASNSTLTGRQWGFAPRIGLVWSPSFVKNFVVRTGFGIYYDRGEYFSEFSPSAGFGISGPFGVTIQPPFVLPVVAQSGANLSNPFGTTPPPVPSGNPAAFAALLPNLAQTASGNYPAGNQFGPYLFGGYNPRNVLPYTENWTLDLQWQPRNTVVLTAAYVGNRGLHEVLPIPFNQPLIATPQNPVNGQIYSYSLNVTSKETLNTLDGGNIDVRVPYLGYSPNSVLWTAEGISTYNALQLGVTKRMSHGLQVGASYTWSHSLDEGSGLGLFYNGNNPFDPRSSYASSDFDRTHVLTFNYLYSLPKVGTLHGLLDKVANGWAVAGTAVLESGQPYNVYDFSGGLASIYYGPGNDYITNPTVPLAPGFTVASAQTGALGTDPNHPALNPKAFTIPIIQPGQMGVPACDPGNPPVCDNFETNFGNGGRNTFRSAAQERGDISIIKNIAINDRVALKYSFDIFNLTNTPSFDAPNNNVLFSPCFSGVASCGFSFPPVGNLGVVQHTIGSPRFIQMALHLTF